jgi:methylated-DNA-[protein]-cysteine S-methyltransferase
MATFVFDSPVGPLYTEVTANGVRRVDLLSPTRSLRSRDVEEHGRALETGSRGVLTSASEVTKTPHQAEEHVSATERHVLDALATQIDEYFDGSRPDFDLPLDVDTGSDFQRRIWQTIATIPHGEVLSYAEVAIRAGYPNAFRAVGSACGANPVALVVPCHRVVASGGKLGGYGGGLEMKVWLLRHEGFVCTAARPDATVRKGSLVGSIASTND